MTEDSVGSAPALVDVDRSALIRGRWFGLLAIVSAAASFSAGLQVIGLIGALALAAIGLSGGPLARSLSWIGMAIAAVSASILLLPLSA